MVKKIEEIKDDIMMAKLDKFNFYEEGEDDGCWYWYFVYFLIFYFLLLLELVYI